MKFTVCIHFDFIQTYFVTSHRSSQSMIIVEHDYHHSLYLSDETGTYYSLSLEDITVQVYDISTRNFAIDLEVVSNVLFVLFNAFYMQSIQGNFSDLSDHT